MKPVLMYVDDEAHNLTVFEASLPDDWEIHCFDNPLVAMDQMDEIKPWVVVSDQRMPGMVGVKFLELVKKLHPACRRVLVTGYSDEDLVVESVRTAKVSDYIRKPWETEDLEVRLTKAIEAYQMEMSLEKQRQELEEQNSSLRELSAALEEAQKREKELRTELEAWAPPFVLQTVGQSYPLQKDLSVLTFDICDSAKLHDLAVEGKPVRALVLKAFSELVIKYGGWRESHSGDSAYAHFGLVGKVDRPAEAALSVATEFRVFLRSFSQLHGIQVECGVGLHMAKSCLVDLHVAEIDTPAGRVRQKSLDTTSPDIDLVHRMEKFTHQIPGSNLICSEAFMSALGQAPAGLIDLGCHVFKGQKEPVRLFLKASDQASPEQVARLQDLKDENILIGAADLKAA